MIIHSFLIRILHVYGLIHKIYGVCQCILSIPDQQLKQRLEPDQVHSEFWYNLLRQGVYEEMWSKTLPSFEYSTAKQ